MMGSASTYMFQKNLKDMITAIRAQKGDGSQKNFINKCLQDIRTEVRRCRLRIDPVSTLPARRGPPLVVRFARSDPVRTPLANSNSNPRS